VIHDPSAPRPKQKQQRHTFGTQTLKDQTQAKLSLLMTIPQVQHELQCSRSTVYLLLGSKSLVAVKVKGATRIKRASLIRYVDENTLEGHYAA